MNASLRLRLFAWISAAIVVAALLAAAVSFKLTYDDANETHDDQLEQIARVLASQTIVPPPLMNPKLLEDPENQLVVKLLGDGPVHPDPTVDVAMPMKLRDGLQTVKNGGERWRVMVGRDAAGKRFGVGQRMRVREEAGSDTAFLTLIPLLALVPVLMTIVALILRQAFAPMTRLGADVDRLDGSAVAVLDEREVPLESLPLLQAINRLMRRLGAALEQQRRLVSDAAHELRTPVAALIVQAENVQHVELPPEAAERMGTLRRGLARMSALIDQMLDLARVQGSASSRTQPFQLDALVRNAIEEALPLAQAKAVDLGCPRIELTTLQGDPMHAFALIRNAIDNAVRYTPGGGAVDVSVFIDGDDACFVVEDDGPGIAEADLARAFEPFVRVAGSGESGSGLGLAIVRTAAAALGGRVELGARPDGRTGLRFVYRQPRQRSSSGL